MEDEEFISGNLDTGFISRFAQRRKGSSPDEVTSDIAIIAAALSESNKKAALPVAIHSNGPSRWVMSGRGTPHDR
jgi:hypothetical protein